MLFYWFLKYTYHKIVTWLFKNSLYLNKQTTPPKKKTKNNKQTKKKPKKQEL